LNDQVAFEFDTVKIDWVWYSQNWQGRWSGSFEKRVF